jgi:hypothetical protein
VSKRAKELGFVEWGEGFFAYLEREKSETNPALLELVYCLGDEGRQELALSIFNFLRPGRWREFCENRQETGRIVTRKLSKMIKDFNRAAIRYRELYTLAPEIGVGAVVGAAAPSGFPDILEREATRLASQLETATFTFSKKRAGTKENLSILIRLQEFVDEFGRCWGDHLPEHARRHLVIVDIADLLEAGKSALGWPETKSFTDPRSIERSLQRFRKHTHNQTLCLVLRANAIATCHALPLRAPSNSLRA